MLATGLIALYIVLAILIAVQLVKTMQVDRDERIAATRVVYYLVVSTWIMVRIAGRLSLDIY